MSNINTEFFEGHYKEIWKTMIPAELTVKEVDFMLSYFNLKPGDSVLDLMSGYGRHAIALGRKGISVTAIDNLQDYISEMCETTESEGLPVKCIRADVLEYKIEGDFDLAICMGNSLNFFDAEETGMLLRNVSDHLRPGAHLLINSWSIAEIAIKNFKERGWGPIGDFKFLTDSKFLLHPTRIETESTIILPDGSTETKTGVDFIFSINEMETMLQEAGFLFKEIYSIPGKKKFTLGEPRAYIVASKI